MISKKSSLFNMGGFAKFWPVEVLGGAVGSDERQARTAAYTIAFSCFGEATEERAASITQRNRGHRSSTGRPSARR